MCFSNVLISLFTEPLTREFKQFRTILYQALLERSQSSVYAPGVALYELTLGLLGNLRIGIIGSVVGDPISDIEGVLAGSILSAPIPASAKGSSTPLPGTSEAVGSGTSGSGSGANGGQGARYPMYA